MIVDFILDIFVIGLACLIVGVALPDWHGIVIGFFCLGAAGLGYLEGR